jgi:hypothetical protein
MLVVQMNLKWQLYLFYLILVKILLILLLMSWMWIQLIWINLEKELILVMIYSIIYMEISIIIMEVWVGHHVLKVLNGLYSLYPSNIHNYLKVNSNPYYQEMIEILKLLIQEILCWFLKCLVLYMKLWNLGEDPHLV